MTKIVAFAGKKQSGKGTSYNFIKMHRTDAVEFSFAEPLKRMCVDLLGLEEWQAFGTDDQKNTPVSHLLWDNFPIPVWDKLDGGIFVGNPDGLRFKYDPTAYITVQQQLDSLNVGNGVSINPNIKVLYPDYSHTGLGVVQLPEYDPLEGWHNGDKLRRKTGVMTAREVLQFWGSEVFRKAYYNVWADACIRKINKLKPGLAVITDVRFPNEVEAVHNAGGKVVRLTRHPYQDEHSSEKALDPEVFDWNRFDYVLDNKDMDVAQQCSALYPVLRKWKLIPAKSSKRIHL